MLIAVQAMIGVITKLTESGVLCGNITEHGVAKVILRHPNKVILLHSTPDEGGFVFMPCYSYSFIYPYLTARLR